MFNYLLQKMKIERKYFYRPSFKYYIKRDNYFDYRKIIKESTQKYIEKRIIDREKYKYNEIIKKYL